MQVIAILNSSKTRSSNLVAKELQKAIDIICKSDVFVNEVFRPANQQKDPLAADLMEGLMVVSFICIYLHGLSKAMLTDWKLLISPSR